MAGYTAPSRYHTGSGSLLCSLLWLSKVSSPVVPQLPCPRCFPQHLLLPAVEILIFLGEMAQESGPCKEPPLKLCAVTFSGVTTWRGSHGKIYGFRINVSYKLLLTSKEQRENNQAHGSKPHVLCSGTGVVG